MNDTRSLLASVVGYRIIRLRQQRLEDWARARVVNNVQPC
jgi:hypothetical protein